MYMHSIHCTYRSVELASTVCIYKLYVQMHDVHVFVYTCMCTILCCSGYLPWRTIQCGSYRYTNTVHITQSSTLCVNCICMYSLYMHDARCTWTMPVYVHVHILVLQVNNTLKKMYMFMYNHVHVHVCVVFCCCAFHLFIHSPSLPLFASMLFLQVKVQMPQD